VDLDPDLTKKIHFQKDPLEICFWLVKHVQPADTPKIHILKKNIKLKLKFAMCMALLPYKIAPPPNPKTHKI